LKIFPKKSPLTFSDPPPGKCKKAPIPRKFSGFRTREWKNLPSQYLAGGPKKWQNMVEKTEKLDFFSRQNSQKSGKNPAKTAQNPGKMTEKQRQSTGGGHP
jgi:hypothetical protein